MEANGAGTDAGSAAGSAAPAAEPAQSTQAPNSLKRKLEDTEEADTANNHSEHNNSGSSTSSSGPAAAQEDKKVKLEPQAEAEVPGKKVIVPEVAPKVRYIPLKTGLCYDVRMRYHAKIFTSYYEYIDPHPEDPRRIYRIYKILAEAGLINDPTLAGVDNIGDLMLKIPVREARADEILQVHSEEHLKYIESTAKMSKEKLLEETEKGDSIYVNNDSFLGAKLSCGGAIEACKAVIEGKVKNSLAVVRPPGHHAEPDAPGGFCLFSNVAVAAKNILKNYPESVRKIVILDWDVHHGNGTQKAFYNDPRVLYISLHRYEAGKYYPGTIAGSADQVGEGEGKGTNINIPWPVGGMGDADYMYAFNKVIMPACYEFDPDLVIISSGFDAAEGDMIGQCHVSPGCYGHMTHMLKSLAKGNLCVVLEGGYNLDSIAVSALAVTKVLIGEPPDELKTKVPQREAVETIEKVLEIQYSYFKSLRPGYIGIENCSPFLDEDPHANSSNLNKTFNLQDAIRFKQADILQTKYNFIELPILSEKQESAANGATNSSTAAAAATPKPTVTGIENQILASSNIYDAETVLIIVHDPLEVWAKVDAITGLINPSSSLIIDSTLKLIDWGVSRNYSIIDINIPESSLIDDSYNSMNSSQEILLYLWDNYLQYFSTKKVAFVSFGDAYSGIVHLLGHRETRNIVKASISIVDKKPLRPIVPLIDESITDWYFKNSLVFTSFKNACWGGNSNENKKPRKKYGRVLKSEMEGIDNIMEERFEECTDFILDSFEEFDSSSSE